GAVGAGGSPRGLESRADPRRGEPLEPRPEAPRELGLAVEVVAAQERRPEAREEERPPPRVLAAELVDEAPVQQAELRVEELGGTRLRPDHEPAVLSRPGDLGAHVVREEVPRRHAPGEAAVDLELLDAEGLLVDVAGRGVAGEECYLGPLGEGGRGGEQEAEGQKPLDHQSSSGRMTMKPWKVRGPAP